MLGVVKPKNPHLGPQKDLGSLGPEKPSKNCQGAKHCFEPME
jgi:hypothetical protein